MKKSHYLKRDEPWYSRSGCASAIWPNAKTTDESSNVTCKHCLEFLRRQEAVAALDKVN